MEVGRASSYRITDGASVEALEPLCLGISILRRRVSLTLRKPDAGREEDARPRRQRGVTPAARPRSARRRGPSDTGDGRLLGAHALDGPLASSGVVPPNSCQVRSANRCRDHLHLPDSSSRPVATRHLAGFRTIGITQGERSSQAGGPPPPPSRAGTGRSPPYHSTALRGLPSCLGDERRKLGGRGRNGVRRGGPGGGQGPRVH